MTALSFEELSVEQVELLPSRETLALWSTNWANIGATNVALSQNTWTMGSLANAAAGQTILVSQS
ncbi:hypothetical protein ACFUC1_06595 [Pedococcus sp. NPDC057267]|uniref:hypothetical protein n=1 Tax=Pedococcus sp. NPDC057267 TaxID=3346077 RepID=UPI00362E8815